MPDAVRWRNRVQELRYCPPGALADHPYQHRLHSPEQRAHLVGILDEIGIAGGLLAWPSARNNHQLTAIDGHLRKSLDPDVPWPVLITDLTDAEADILLLAYDWIGAQAQSGKDELARLLAQVQPQTAAVQALQASIAEQAGIPWGPQGGGETTEDPGPQIDRAAELQAQWGTETGQLWEIGPHRLLCGDCTEKGLVETLMHGRMASLVLTDPPYGVSYADKNTFLNTIARGNHIQTPMASDHASKADIQALWKAAFSVMAEVMAPGAVVYCFMPQGGDQMMMMMMMEGAGIEPRHELIWVKNNHVLGRVDYAYKHEPILYAWKAGGHQFYGDFQTSLLEYPKPQQSDLHPTTKPVALISRLMTNSSRQGETVYDPFLGSGTTMVAAEQLQRACYAMEISPAYVGVCLERMQGLGLTPRLLETS